MNTESILTLLVAALKAVLQAFESNDYDELRRIAGSLQPDKESVTDKVKKLLGVK